MTLSTSSIRALEPRIRPYSANDGNGLALLGQRLKAAKGLLARGIDPAAQRRAGKAAQYHTFELVAREWLATGQQMLQKKQIAPQAHRRKTGILRRYLIPAFRGRPIASITAQDVLVVIKQIEAAGLNNTAHRARQMCVRVFQFALLQGYVSINPAESTRGLLEPLHHRAHPAITAPARLAALLQALERQPPTFACPCSYSCSCL